MKIGQKRSVKHRTSGSQFSASSASPTAAAKNVEYKKIFKISIYSIIFLALIYAIVLSPLLRIKKIEISGLQTLNQDDINYQLEKIIAGSYFNNNILFISGGQIDSQLRADNYQIAKAEIIRVPFNTLKVVVQEQKPSILWQSNGSLSIFKEDGRAYAGEPSDELKSTLPIVEDSTNLEVVAGSQIVSRSFLEFVTMIYRQLPEKGIKATSFEIKETTTELFVSTQAGYVIRFDTTRPSSEQLTDLVAVLDLLQQRGSTPKEYIDLRVNGRAFYK